MSASQNNPADHIGLLERYLTALPYLLDIKEDLLAPYLWHDDLHAANIFVDKGKITSIIDWQNTIAAPLLLQGTPPSLINYLGPEINNRPENFDELDDDQKANIKQQLSKSKLFQLYCIYTRETNPLLSEIYGLDHGKTRRMPIVFAENTWDDDIIAFREALINVQR